MSIYAIKDEDGELRDTDWDSPKITKTFYAYTGLSADDVTAVANRSRNAHVVELVEKAEPVEVGKAADGLLKRFKQEVEVGDTQRNLDGWFRDIQELTDMSTADIFRALDIGWTVKQPQLWYVMAPKEWDSVSGRQRFYKRSDNSIGQALESLADNTADEQFTAKEIDKYHLGGFETVEVTDHDK